MLIMKRKGNEYKIITVKVCKKSHNQDNTLIVNYVFKQNQKAVCILRISHNQDNTLYIKILIK